MNVLLLGAGASHHAGYPLASELMGALAQLAEDPRMAQYRESWKHWEDYRNGTEGLLRTLLFSPNPEVALSVPDLFAVAIEAEDSQYFHRLKEAYDRGEQSVIAEYEAYLASGTRSALHKATIASRRFLDCIDWFFWLRHHQDRVNPTGREYLRSLLAPLRHGDVVITLNWDTTAERTLGEQGKWNPWTGYGFPKRLVHKADHFAVAVSLAEHVPESPVQVLKLHGSFGWLVEQGRVVFDGSRFLRELPFVFERQDVVLNDPEAPSIGIPDELALAYPSFLKRLETAELQEVWAKAAIALMTADRIDVWGYSLPASDTAVRALLAPLRTRIDRGDAVVAVHDPSAAALGRWKDYLGPSAKYIREALQNSVAGARPTPGA